MKGDLTSDHTPVRIHLSSLPAFCRTYAWSISQYGLHSIAKENAKYEYLIEDISIWQCGFFEQNLSCTQGVRIEADGEEKPPYGLKVRVLKQKDGE